jgi:hypothetical protein
VENLLAAIVIWLSLEVGLPAATEHPRIEFASAATMVAIRHRDPASGRAPRAGAQEFRAGRPDLVALYDDSTRTIYLRDTWTGATPAEVSVLVHEMAHHLQNVAGLKYECPQAREELAYRAQERWLARSGRSLAKEFKLDPMTLLVRSKCMH